MLYNIKPIHLHRVFHGIRFKVNNEDWLSVMDSLFSFIYPGERKCFNTRSILYGGCASLGSQREWPRALRVPKDMGNRGIA